MNDLDWSKEIDKHFSVNKKYKPGTLWMVRETIWGWDAKILTKDYCLNYGDFVMVLGYYQHENLLEDVLVLHSNNVVICASVDVSHVFDLSPAKNLKKP